MACDEKEELLSDVYQGGTAPLKDVDPEVFAIIKAEEHRQRIGLELIASEVSLFSHSPCNSIFCSFFFNYPCAINFCVCNIKKFLFFLIFFKQINTQTRKYTLFFCISLLV